MQQLSYTKSGLIRDAGVVHMAIVFGQKDLIQYNFEEATMKCSDISVPS